MKKKYNYSISILFSIVLAFPTQQDFSKAFIRVAEQTNPAVVSIISEKTIEQNYHFFLEICLARNLRDKL